MATTVRTWRQLTIWLHVLSSVGWMSMALVLFALLARGEPGAAHVVDEVLLAPLANASAFTGLVLALGTAWGLIHHTWVLVKFAITFVQLYLGIFLLSGALADSALTGSTPLTLVVGTVLMASAIAVQAWLSIAKPGPRTRWAKDRTTGRPIKLPTAPNWVFVAGVGAPLADIALGAALGFPAPAFEVVLLVVVVIARRVAVRRVVAGRAAVPAGAG